MTRGFVIPERHREDRDRDVVDERRQEALDDARHSGPLIAWETRRRSEPAEAEREAA